MRNYRLDNNPISLDPLNSDFLPKPNEILFANSSSGSELDKSWSVHVSPANRDAGRVSVEQGCVCFTGQHYKYCYIARPLSQDNISAQVRIQVPRTGCARGWNPGLGLWWGNGNYCFITGGGYKGGDEVLVIRGCGARRIPLGKKRLMRVRDDNRYDFWVKIVLTSDKIRFCSSLDAKRWHVEAEARRSKEYAGPPRLLILGRGSTGAGQGFLNDARWTTNVKKAYMSEIIVGRQ